MGADDNGDGGDEGGDGPGVLGEVDAQGGQAAAIGGGTVTLSCFGPVVLRHCDECCATDGRSSPLVRVIYCQIKLRRTPTVVPWHSLLQCFR